MSSCVQEETVIVDEGDSVDRRESQGGREWERVVIVDRGESQGLRLCSGGVVITERGESQGRRGGREW